MHCFYFICERKFYARTHVKKIRDTGNQPSEQAQNTLRTIFLNDINKES